MSGFVALHRDATEHPLLLGNAERFGAWFWLVAKACWKPTPFNVAGKVIVLQRSQLCVSRTQLATAWGMKPSAVERFLTRLETEQMIGRETGQGRSIITICNFDKYQMGDEQAGQATGQATGQSSDSHRTTKEQGNKGTIEEVAKATPSTRAKSEPAKVRMFAEWVPGPLPKTVADLVAQWPSGRLEREVEQFRDYWLDRTDKRPGWDRTFHTRIRDIHDRVMKDNRSDRGQRNGWSHTPRDTRDGYTRELHSRLDFGPDELP